MTLFPKIKYFKRTFFKVCIFVCCLIFCINHVPILLYKANGIGNAANYVEGLAECVMELNSRRVLYERNGELRLPMASTTKILTATTVLDHIQNLDEIISVPPKAVGIEGSSVYLKEGDEYSIRDLLYGMMLRSGNDCATALGLHVGGDIQNFSKMMNLTAQKAGALHSHFVNPHGLPDGEHRTTARDLCYITCYAMKNPIYRDIVSTQFYEPYGWKNKNKLLTIYKYANGGKTGYTKEAGRCLVSSAQKENMTLICCVLNCATTYERSINLFNDAFACYENVKILAKEQPITLEKNGKIYTACAKEDFYYPLLNDEKEFIQIKSIPINQFKNNVKKNEIIGKFEIYFLKQLLFSGNLYKL